MSRRRFQRGRLIELANGWSCRYYEDILVDGKRQRKRVQVFLGTSELTKRQAQKAMSDTLASVNDVMHKPLTTTTFRQYAKLWIEDCKNRKQNPSKRSTLALRKSVLEKHVLPCLGDIPLSSVDNKAMRTLAAVLDKKGLKPQTILNVLTITKSVKASATDENGNQLYTTKWNPKFIDAPTVKREQQRRPIFTADQVASIVTAATGRLQMAAILFAASGLRAGELLGLECRHFDGASVTVEQSIWGGKKQEPKTQNAKRYVDLHPDVASLLKQFIGDRKSGFIFETSSGRPIGQSNILNHGLHPLLTKLGIAKCGFHAFRRFRNTFLRKQRCPDSILKAWMGHSIGGDMSALYDRSAQEDSTYRKDVALAMGIGFELPKLLAAKRPKSPEVGVIGRQEVLTACND